MTHRCKELLEYNKNSHGVPVSIQHGKWFDKIKIDSDFPSWTLSNLTWDSEYDVKYMSKACRIKYCPFCGEKLKDYDKINIDK